MEKQNIKDDGQEYKKVKEKKINEEFIVQKLKNNNLEKKNHWTTEKK